MPRELRYLTFKTVEKKERVTEHVEAKLSKIQYRDAKGKIVKFTTKKRLRVEVVFRIKRGVKWVTEKSVSYGLPLRKRQKPVAEKIIHNQIYRKHIEKLKKGHLIVDTSDPMRNLYSWTYFYQDKTKAEKAAIRKKKREIVKKHQRMRVKHLAEKGSKREHRKSKKY